ncbi:MAG: hypothetical protein DDT31_01724 [Syntrophomonadaceae bacterium]|nr:hypothetical protein [Bacillota bacterium]
MNVRPLSLIVLCLMLSGILLMFVAGGGFVAKLPPSPISVVGATIVCTNTYSYIALPTEMPIYNIPLSLSLQKFIWEMCQENNLSYELVLSIISVESNFIIDAVGITKDLGLMQLNPFNTMNWLAEQVNISDFDPFNPYHNVTAGIWYLLYIRDYWAQYEFDQQHIYSLVLLSYNRGIGGTKSYVRRLGQVAFQNSYILKVSNYKYMLERGH